jgi:hypothetical protein
MARKTAQVGKVTFTPLASLESPAELALSATSSMAGMLDAAQGAKADHPDMYLEDVLDSLSRARERIDSALQQGVLWGVCIEGMSNRAVARPARLAPGTVDRWVASVRDNASPTEAPWLMPVSGMQWCDCDLWQHSPVRHNHPLTYDVVCDLAKKELQVKGLPQRLTHKQVIYIAMRVWAFEAVCAIFLHAVEVAASTVYGGVNVDYPLETGLAIVKEFSNHWTGCRADACEIDWTREQIEQGQADSAMRSDDL